VSARLLFLEEVCTSNSWSDIHQCIN